MIARVNTNTHVENVDAYSSSTSPVSATPVAKTGFQDVHMIARVNTNTHVADVDAYSSSTSPVFVIPVAKTGLQGDHMIAMVKTARVKNNNAKRNVAPYALVLIL